MAFSHGFPFSPIIKDYYPEKWTKNLYRFSCVGFLLQGMSKEKNDCQFLREKKIQLFKKKTIIFFLKTCIWPRKKIVEKYLVKKKTFFRLPKKCGLKNFSKCSKIFLAQSLKATAYLSSI